MSYATDKGMVVGRSYVYNSGSDGIDELDGKSLRFRSDDCSTCPAFDVPYDVDSDGWMYLSLKHFEVNPQAGSGSFSVDVSNGKTTVTVGKELTAAQVAKMLEAAGVK